MERRRLIVTGASGFVGRQLLAELAHDTVVYALARRSQARCGALSHPNVRWRQVDVGEKDALEAVFRAIRDEGGVETVVHLAAYYDFTGSENPEYERTNVVGLRNTLEAARRVGVRRFVFGSSVAASRFPKDGGTLDESSPPDGEHVYARTKRMGEEMLREFSSSFETPIVRLAALFSDWCEYAPLFHFLKTWLSPSWDSRILGGNGRSAIPYLHVRDAALFLRRVVEHEGPFAPGEVLMASPDGAVSHRELFETATLDYFGRRARPVTMPRVLCGPGLLFRQVAGALADSPPFERPWMARYVDRVMAVNASKTRSRLGFAPRERLSILRRLPFLVENLRTDPVEWHARNEALLREEGVPAHLRLYNLLERNEERIIGSFDQLLRGESGRDRFSSYQRLGAKEHDWDHRVVLRHLMNAVRTEEKGIFTAYCRDLAARRFSQGFRAEELKGAFETLGATCFGVLRSEPEFARLEAHAHDSISMGLRIGADEVEEVFETMEAGVRRSVGGEVDSNRRAGLGA